MNSKRAGFDWPWPSKFQSQTTCSYHSSELFQLQRTNSQMDCFAECTNAIRICVSSRLIELRKKWRFGRQITCKTSHPNRRLCGVHLGEAHAPCPRADGLPVRSRQPHIANFETGFVATCCSKKCEAHAYDFFVMQLHWKKRGLQDRKGCALASEDVCARVFGKIGNRS